MNTILTALITGTAGVTVFGSLVICPLSAAENSSSPPPGYYRFPTIHGDQLVFTAEGDLWKGGIQGGVAQRLTSHPGSETHPAFSPDGKTLAFAAEYEGPTEAYTMPAAGGLPTRRTYDGVLVESIGWTPDGRLLYSEGDYWTLPDPQLSTLDLANGKTEVLPLSQATRGVFDDKGASLYFTRLPFHRGNVKRYQGGTAENLWKFARGDDEAKPLTADYPGTSRTPMWWKGRVYFLSDRDGTMNLWSMNPDGGDLKQHTQHKGRDAKWPSLSEGRIAYQLGADLRLYDITNGQDALIPITLLSDYDQEREKWVKKPMDFVTSEHLSPNGDRVVLTARGQVFVAPVGPGRFVEVTRQAAVRHRFARFMPDGKSILALSDESGEVEFVQLPANGVGQPESLTKDGKVLRFDGVPSPDGKRIIWGDKDQKLWLFDVEKKETRLIAESPHWFFQDPAWSPDSRWLAYVVAAENEYQQIWIYDTTDGSKQAVTTDRVYSTNPAWSADGKWLYFISERHLQSVVSSPWGARQPEPFFDKLGKIYAMALTNGLRSPFEAPDELHPAKPEKPEKTEKAPEKADDKSSKPGGDKEKTEPEPAKAAKSDAGTTNKSVEVKIEFAGIESRVWEVPVPPGNLSDLAVNEKRLFWLSTDTAVDGKRQVQVLDISNDEPKPKTFAEDVRAFELSSDGKKVLVRKKDSIHVEDTGASAPAKLEKTVDLKGWTFSIRPRDEWRQMFVEAWRLERDYFYDRRMHGVDWPAMLKKYLPTVDRVTDRAELSDLIGDMVGELSALHIRVAGGDLRDGPDEIKPAGLGARLVRDEAGGGWQVDYIYRTDPDYPDKLSPLARPGVNVKQGDIIEMINGEATLSSPHPQAQLRNQAGKQVLLRVKTPGDPSSRDVVVKPVSTGQEAGLRYSDWEYTRRLRVEELGKGDIGYVHLRAMSGEDIAQWTREYYPVYNRKGLIIDVRHNGGGNIDSWILGKLLRKAWFYWQPRVGSPTWNMQYAFRGHMVVLCDEFTGSDGEAFTEGFKRLGLGKVIGNRTWGGEIWLTASNFLVDYGIATAAEIGVYGPEGQWLIEGHGVDPDIVVDNLPHATFKGGDAQLQKAIEYLQEEIRLKPITVPPPPPYPDKSAK